MADGIEMMRQLETIFPAEICRRGADYVRKSRVELLAIEKSRVSANIHGSQGNEYEVHVGWDRDGVVEVDCTCPYHLDSGPCKHVWAVLLALTQSQVVDSFPDNVTELNQMTGDGGLSIENHDELSVGEFRGGSENLQRLVSQLLKSMGGRTRAGRRRGAPRSKSKKKQRPQWEQDLSAAIAPVSSKDLLGEVGGAKRAEYRIVLDVSLSQAEQLLWFSLQWRERGTTGNFGKWKQKLLQAWDRHEDSPQQALVWNLVDTCNIKRQANQSSGYYGGYYRPESVADLRISLPELLGPIRSCCEAGIVVWRLGRQSAESDVRSVEWDTDGSWSLKLEVTSDAANQSWNVTGWLVQSGSDRRIRPHDAVLVIGGLVVLHEDRLAPLLRPEDSAWVKVLRGKPEISIPFADRDRFLELCFQSNLPLVEEWPADLALVQVSVTPVPRLIVRPRTSRLKSNRSYLGEVHFDYGDHPISPRDPRQVVRIADPDRLIRRDAEAERTSAEQLLSHPGVQLYVRNTYAYGSADVSEGEHDIEFPEAQLPALLDHLMAAGWNVEAEGQQVRSAGDFDISITSSIDWFDLSGSCDFGGVSAKLPELLQAVRRGEGHVELSDGSRGLLSEDLRDRLLRMLDFGEQDGKTLRFRGAQALLIDAMLSEQKQTVNLDSGFRKLKERLQAVQGVEPKSAPKTFQGELRPYQQEGLGWLTFLQEFSFGGCLADDMGLGKTVQVLALLEGRRTRKLTRGEQHSPSIVVVPKSLIFNWVNEAARFAPQLRVVTYHGLGRRALLEKSAETDLYVTTYGTLRQDIGYLREMSFDYAILDEAQAIKNPTAQVSKVVRLLQARHRLAMTGTPVENHLGDLWSLFDFLSPGLLGRSQNFQRLTKEIAERPASLQTLAQGIRPYVLRRTKENVLTELPDKTEQTIACELSLKEQMLYNELRDHYRQSLLGRVEQQGLAKSKIHVLEALLRLRQAACHPGLVNKAHLKHSSAKLDALEEQLESLLSEGHKALIFSQFTSLLSILKARLDRKKIPYEYLDGKTRKRQQCVDRFQTDEQCRLFLISLKAGGQGLNLTAADYVFILDPWWNPAVEAQAIDRAHRMGQQRHVMAYRLIASGTVEEKIIALQAQKRELAESIISEDASVLQSLSLDDLQLLLS